MAAEQGPSAWGQALRVCGVCVVSALCWLATDGASGKELDSSASHTPSSLPPLSPPFFPLSFLSLSLSLLFSHHLLHPRPVQEALIVLCPSEDALRHWLIAKLLLLFGRTLPPISGCPKPCLLSMPSKPPAPQGTCLNLFLLESFKGERLSLHPPGNADVTHILSYIIFPITLPGSSVLG